MPPNCDERDASAVTSRDRLFETRASRPRGDASLPGGATPGARRSRPEIRRIRLPVTPGAIHNVDPAIPGETLFITSATRIRGMGPAMLSEDLLALLVCPMGKAPLRPDGESLVCTLCGPRFSIKDDIPNMLIEEAELPADCRSLAELPCVRSGQAKLDGD